MAAVPEERAASHDDIIELRATRLGGRPQTTSRELMDHFLRPRPASQLSQPSSHHSAAVPSPPSRSVGSGLRPPPIAAARRNAQRHEQRGQRRRLHHHHHYHHHHHVYVSPPRQTEPTVIDLTEEPDSPVQARPLSVSQSQPSSRNPRRTDSQRSTPPRLARSDSTSMAFASSAAFIDLTVDSPEDEPADSLRSRTLRPLPSYHHLGLPFGTDEMISLELIRNAPRFPTPRLPMPRSLGRRLAGILGAGVLGGRFSPPDLDISQTPFLTRREPSPKPPMEPVPPVHAGFTRDTCAAPEDGLERVVVCPTCNEELAYDPTCTELPSSTGCSARKRKRASGYHRFWAVKKCGHVYCADCFENRKPTKSSPNGVGFPGPNGVLPCAVPTDIRCAVHDCETRVALKAEWVGIYL